MRILSTVACALVGIALVVATSEAAPRRHTTAAKRAGKTHASATHRTRVAAKQTVAGAPGAAGMMIAIDPETGQYRMPTPDELQVLQQMNRDDALNLSNQGLVSEPLPGGGIKVNLQGRFQDYSVVRVGKDGKLIYGCGQTQAGAMAETYAPNRPTGVLEDK
jgi:hypothetical protein